jgi:hypothetical protein
MLGADAKASKDDFTFVQISDSHIGFNRPPYDEGVFYGSKEVERAPIVSPLQLYLDLTQTKGRGEEAASAILEEVIKRLWR